jgi:DNA-binding IclR family transcriptional regulator
MQESETLVVFRILGILAKARELGHALPLEEIADAAHLGRVPAQRYMNVLQHAGAVRTEISPAWPSGYSLTRYGLERLLGGCARRSGPAAALGIRQLAQSGA